MGNPSSSLGSHSYVTLKVEGRGKRINMDGRCHSSSCSFDRNKLSSWVKGHKLESQTLSSDAQINASRTWTITNYLHPFLAQVRIQDPTNLLQSWWQRQATPINLKKRHEKDLAVLWPHRGAECHDDLDDVESTSSCTDGIAICQVGQYCISIINFGWQMRRK